jgi:hypothetical protein
VGLSAQALDVAHGVGRAGAGAEGRCANVDRIRAMVDGCNANVYVTRRCKEFDLV